MPHLVVNSREQLLALIKSGPKPTTQKTCSKCQQPVYRVIIKGCEKWMECKCNKGKAHHYI